MGCASTAGAKLCEANIEIPADIREVTPKS